MLKKIFFLLWSYEFVIACESHLLTVVLMVKNEESVIIQTLEPFIQAHINNFIIFDTGSTDNTSALTESYFKGKKTTQAYIFQEPFIDFATSRNRALELAEEKFPDALFLLMPDAEWYLKNADDLLKFCKEHKDDTDTCYLLRLTNSSIDFMVPRLIRAHTKTRFIGDIHESIPQAQQQVPRTVFFELGFTRTGIEKSRRRWERDLALLLKRYDEDPTSPRTLFYLAQTYECLCDFENAYKFYELRSRYNGFIEETYETFYRLGRITHILSQQDIKFTWHLAQDYYFTAHNILPHRAEPLVKIAEHYWPDGTAPLNSALCYLFAKRAYELAYPEKDLLFIDPYMYNFQRYELLSKAAWQVGDYELGELATRKALQYKELPYLLRNLAWYLEAKEKK